MKKQGGYHLKKGDYILIGVLLIVGFVIVFGHRIRKEDGEKVIITVKGETYKVLNINQEQELKVELDDGHYNIIKIEQEKVKMLEADCSNQVCVNSAEITSVGETIVCLPHQVVVKIVVQDSDLLEGGHKE